MFPKTKIRFYYGWVIVIVITITTVILMGTRHSFGIFFKPLASEFDLNRTATSSLFSMYWILCAVFCIVGGWAMDRYGSRLLFFLMGLFTGLSLLLTSQVTSWWQLFLSYSLLLSIGTGPLYTIAQSTVSKWFSRRRGVAMGVTHCGMGIGQILYSPLSAFLISGYGWRVSYIVLGLLVCVFVIPLSILMRNDPSKMGAPLDSDEFKTTGTAIEAKEEELQLTGLSLSQAVRSWNYWIYLPAWFFIGISNWMVLTHIVPYATDLGIPSIEASTIISVNGIFGMLSAIFIGRITDVKGRKNPGIFLALIRATALIGLIWAREIWAFYLFGMAFGICQSGLSIVLGAMCADIFGMRHLGMIMGTLGAVFSLGASVGPLIGGLFYDASGSYTMAFVTSSVVSMLSALSLALIRVETKSETK